MTILENYPWPTPPGCHTAPVWVGNGFLVEDQEISVLSYNTGISGWTDALTTFHEEKAGENHVIDGASRQHCIDQLKAFLRPGSPLVLDIGCSSGFMLREVIKCLPDAIAVGSDYVRGPLDQLAVQLPNIPLLQFDLRECPLPNNSIDAVILLNVLEHIENDTTALWHVNRILRPGGITVIEVPAGPNLFDVYDKLLMHYRRYSAEDLRRRVEAVGLQVIHQSHLGFFVYPGFWLVKRRNRRYLDDSDSQQREVVSANISLTRNNWILQAFMDLELKLGKRVSYPLGIRCLITARKL